MANNLKLADNIDRILGIVRETLASYENGRPRPTSTDPGIVLGLEDLSPVDLYLYWKWYFKEKRRVDREAGLDVSSSSSSEEEEGAASDASEEAPADTVAEQPHRMPTNTENPPGGSPAPITPRKRAAKLAPADSRAQKIQNKNKGRVKKAKARLERTRPYAVDHLWCIKCFRAANEDRGKSLAAKPPTVKGVGLPACSFDTATVTRCQGCVASASSCFPVAGLMVGDAIDCARILDFLQDQYDTPLEDDDRYTDNADETHFFSAPTRLVIQRLAHDLCLAFEAVETQHRTVFHLTDKANSEIWEKYRNLVIQQRTLLTRQYPAPVITPLDTVPEHSQSTTRETNDRRQREWELTQLPRLHLTDRHYMPWQVALKAVYVGFRNALSSSEENITQEYIDNALARFPIRAKSFW